MKNKIKCLIIILIALICLSSCSKDDDDYRMNMPLLQFMVGRWYIGNTNKYIDIYQKGVYDIMSCKQFMIYENDSLVGHIEKDNSPVCYSSERLQYKYKSYLGFLVLKDAINDSTVRVNNFPSTTGNIIIHRHRIPMASFNK